MHWRAAVLDRDVGPVLAASFDHVLVDEYQDTSVVQADILRALRSRDARLTVVGDDAQAIYSFRAATVRNILDFPTHFPGVDHITLSRITVQPAPFLNSPTRSSLVPGRDIESNSGPRTEAEYVPFWPRARISRAKPRPCAKPS